MNDWKYSKDEQDVLDYTIDWSEVLEGAEIISASTWTPETGLTLDSDTFSNTTTTAWLSGGTKGETYTVYNLVTTDAGRTYRRYIVISIREFTA